MNQKQREFLVGHIGKQAAEQLEELDEKRPKPPSLNNYIVAAILDGSFQLQTIETIRERIRARALKLGPGDAFVNTNESHFYSRRKKSTNDDEETEVTLNIEDLLMLPPAYKEARAWFDKQLKNWQAKRLHIEQVRDTLLLKVQMGSNEALGKLIDQADNLADIDLISTQLKLTDKREET